MSAADDLAANPPDDGRRDVRLARVGAGAFRVTNAAGGLPRFVQQTHDRICTVSRTVGLGADVAYVLADDDDGHDGRGVEDGAT